MHTAHVCYWDLFVCNVVMVDSMHTTTIIMEDAWLPDNWAVLMSLPVVDQFTFLHSDFTQPIALPVTNDVQYT